MNNSFDSSNTNNSTESSNIGIEMRIFLSILFLLQCLHSIGQSQDSLTSLSYNIEGEVFKSIHLNDSSTFILLSNGNEIKVDTTIFYGFDESEMSSNDSLLFRYYVKNIKSPAHGGEPNFAILSIMTGNEGDIKAINVIRDVENRCKEGEQWRFKTNENFRLYPIKNYNIEYIIKVIDINYCVPLIHKQ